VKRFLFMLLSLSMGLNVGLLYVRYMEKPQSRPGHAAPDHQRMHRPLPPLEVMIRQQLEVKNRHLKLDSTQQKAIGKILETYLPTIVEFKEKSRMANQKVTEVYSSVPFDKIEFQRLMREAGQARSTADSLSAVILIEEASVLTDEQRRLFADVAPMSQGEGHRPPPPRRRH